MFDHPLSLAERLEHRVAKLLLRLPHSVQVKLSGRPPISKDGLTLHPEVQFLLSVRERKGAPSLSSLPPHVSRRKLRREALVHGGKKTPVGKVHDFEIDGPGGELRLRHYAPLDDAKGAPVLVFLHGGGFVVGDFETHDNVCRVLCRDAKMHVLAVDYRLAPEHPFPAAFDDAYAAYKWACANAQHLGADPKRIAIGGDSAGGNLAAVVSQHARADGLQLPVAQLLLYPAIDRTQPRASLECFKEGFFLTRADIEWYQAHYVGAVGGAPHDPRVCPLECRDLSALPPALVVTAGFDPLRDEGEDYAAALKKAGTPVTLRRFDPLIHGFANMAGLSPACREAMAEIARTLAALVQSQAHRAPAQHTQDTQHSRNTQTKGTNP